MKKAAEKSSAVAGESGITVARRTEIDDILRGEGFAGEIVDKIQNMRKSSWFEVTDRIDILVQTVEPLTDAVRVHSGFGRKEMLTDRIELV